MGAGRARRPDLAPDLVPLRKRQTREATGVALRRHADPGAELREATRATRASHWPARRGRRGGSLSPCSSCLSPAWWSASSAEMSGTPPPPCPFSLWRSAPSSWTGSPGNGPAAGWTLRPTPASRPTGDRAHGSRGCGRLGRGRAARTPTGGPALPPGLRRLPGSRGPAVRRLALLRRRGRLRARRRPGDGGMDVPPRTDRADGPLPRAARPARAHRPRPGPAHADR